MVFLTSILQRWGYTHGPHRAHKRIQLFRFTWVKSRRLIN
jgi:hypothetical protein